jgi:hypothetical protein
MPQQLEDGAGRKFGPEPRGCGDGLPQARSLNDAHGDQPNESLRRIAAADQRDRTEGGRLFGHDSISAITGKATAERVENGYGGSQSAASRLGNQGNGIADTGIESGSEQAVVVEGVARDDRPGRAVGGIPPVWAGAHAKEVELLGSRHLPLECLTMVSPED